MGEGDQIGGVCAYFTFLAGPDGHCTNRCDAACEAANSGGGAVLAQCRYYEKFLGVRSSTMLTEHGCNTNTVRHGFITSLTQGALPMLPTDYAEYDISDTNSYGTTLITDENGIYNILSSGDAFTFKQCAESCMLSPNKRCTYFISLIPSDASETCSVVDETVSEATGVCLLFQSDGEPVGKTVTRRSRRVCLH